jgi:cobalamin synthase
MRSALSLQRLVVLMDRALMPRTDALRLQPVCMEIDADVDAGGMTEEEAREIMAEIDAKSSALLAVLAIILATSAFVFSLDQTWLALALMFGQVVTVSVSILFLLRCLIYEPTPHLRRVFEMPGVAGAFHLQIEAIKQVRYFNRVILLTVVTCVLFFVMSLLVGIDAMMRPVA